MPAEKKDAAEEKLGKKNVEAKKDEPEKVRFLLLKIKSQKATSILSSPTSPQLLFFFLRRFPNLEAAPMTCVELSQ